MSHSSRPLVPPSSFPPSRNRSLAIDPRCETRAPRAPRARGCSLVVSLSLLSIGCYHGLDQDDAGTSPWDGPMQSGGGTGESAAEDGGPIPTGGNDGVDESGRPADSSGAADGLDESGGSPTEDTGEPLPPPMLPAGGISVTAVEINQGVSIPVVNDGTLIDVESRNAPLVRNRHMLVRVYWERQADFEPRLLDAVLTLDHGNDQVEELVDSRMINGPPSQDSLDGTFSFVLEPSQVTPDMRFSVGIYEPDQTTSGSLASPLFPADGTAPLGVPDTPMQISLTIVPYRVGNTSPNLSPEALEEFRAHFYAMQPIEFGDDGLRLTIHPQEQSAPYSDAQVVLNSVCSLWDNDVSNGIVDSSEYYQSAVASNTTSGVLGVAYVLNNPNGGPRCGSNLWDTNLNQGPSTMTHEIGHNQGRPHAPCGGVANPDPGYPYSNGSIGVQGWNSMTGQLISSAADYMSYCGRDWVSDYNYRLNAIRNAALQTNANAFVAGAPSEPPLAVVGHQMTTGDVEWSVHRSISTLEALTPAGTATISTVDGQNVDVTLFERELSEGSSVIGVIDGIEHADDIAWIDSSVFGPAVPTAPTALLSP
ncbi:MAG: zinc-dependent metalloprotease family protein [Myxococcota bacterium]